MENKVVIVTGGADGIGKEIAKSFLSSHFDVAAFDIYEAHLKSTHSEYQELGNYLPLLTDVTDEENVYASVKQVLAAFGRIDVLVNNAGGSMAVSQEIEEITAQDWDKVIHLNLRSTFLCTKAVLPAMKERRWGRIINMSSMAGRGRSLFGGTPYAAAKAGIIGFTRQASKELGKYHITVNAVAPGLIISGDRIKDYWQNKKTEDERDHFLNSTPMGRPGMPQDVTGAVLFLSREAASYITGAVIDVNGGFWVG
jgi:NAD(P)-dependent dehydrogenase (short-subunit alcohol dehydrogenase family)